MEQKELQWTQEIEKQELWDVFQATDFVCQNVAGIIEGISEKKLKELEVLIYRYLLHNIGRKGRKSVKNWELMKMSSYILGNDMGIENEKEVLNNLNRWDQFQSLEFELDADEIKSKISNITSAQKIKEAREEEKRQKEQKAAIERAEKIWSSIGPLVKEFYACQGVISDLERLFEKISITTDKIEYFEEKHANWWNRIQDKVSALTNSSGDKALKGKELDEALDAASKFIDQTKNSFVGNVKKFFMYFIDRFERKISERLWELYIEEILVWWENIKSQIENTQSIHLLEAKVDYCKKSIDRYFVIYQSIKEEKMKQQNKKTRRI